MPTIAIDQFTTETGLINPQVPICEQLFIDKISYKLIKTRSKILQHRLFGLFTQSIVVKMYKKIINRVYLSEYLKNAKCCTL